MSALGTNTLTWLITNDSKACESESNLGGISTIPYRLNFKFQNFIEQFVSKQVFKLT